MQIYDVFNGDADGICALIQLRLAEPADTTLITGVKRDTALARRVPTDAPARVNILDISLDKNREAVDELLAAGCSVFYVDHHFPGEELPDSPNFTALINTQPTTCTSLLVDQYLGGRFHNWAIAAAFGDNLNAVGEALAAEAGLSSDQAEALKTLGVCINYNGYGASVEDLYFHPADVYRECVKFEDPLELINSAPGAWQQLRDGYEADMAQGQAAPVLSETASSLVVKLPDEAWARRVSGVLGNELANRNPGKAGRQPHTLDGIGHRTVRVPNLHIHFNPVEGLERIVPGRGEATLDDHPDLGFAGFEVTTDPGLHHASSPS